LLPPIFGFFKLRFSNPGIFIDIFFIDKRCVYGYCHRLSGIILICSSLWQGINYSNWIIIFCSQSWWEVTRICPHLHLKGVLCPREVLPEFKLS
jgi:hypothetical protein